MIFDIAIAVFGKLFAYSYKVLDQYLVANVMAFVRGFEFAIFLIVTLIFVLIAVRITIRHLRQLPKSYVIEIIDLDGRPVSIDGLRQIFSTYEAAESYARVYRKNYDHQYRFKVIGNKEEVAENVRVTGSEL